MADEPTYTYRGGVRLDLTKGDDTFVVRVLLDEANAMGLDALEQVSSASTVVRCDSDERDRQMGEVRESEVAHHSYRTADGTELLITDRVYVAHRDGLTPEELARFAADHALVLLDVLSENERLYQLTDDTGMNPVKLVRLLVEEDDRVVGAENDANHRTTTSLDLPNDSSFLDQWHLHQLASSTHFDPRASSRCDEAWLALDSFGSAEVVIGITDDGCRLDHRDFDSLGKFAGWGYFEGHRLVVDSDLDADPSRMYEVGSDHGTSCAGVAAGEADGILTVGAAPGCRLLPIKWESQGPFLFTSDSKLRKAIDYMAPRVDVMSNSWGHVPVSNTGMQVTSRIQQLQSSGGRRGTGIVFLWAAGNDNCPINHQADMAVPHTSGWERQMGQWVWVGPDTAMTFHNNLVDLPGVLHVGALGSTAQRSHYSNYGTGVDICAPTNNNHIYLGGPLGLGVTTAKGTSAISTTPSFGGTSSATPLVAGIVALIVSANPELSAAEIISILQRSASKDLDFAGWAKTTTPIPGTGQTDWDVSPIAPFDDGTFIDRGDPDGMWSPWFGHGKVDAAAAVAEAKAIATPPPDPLQWQQSLRGQLAGTGDRKAWLVSFTGHLQADLTGPSEADFDLHLRREQPITPRASTRSEGVTSNETIAVQASTPEQWRLTVVSWQGAGQFELTVTISP
ncbi:MAG: S8 family serine peptidase [Actinomycetia bacterium]|nr:S8 family serine peptidase [Actinomycetes bacterium]